MADINTSNLSSDTTTCSESDSISLIWVNPFDETKYSTILDFPEKRVPTIAANMMEDRVRFSLRYGTNEKVCQSHTEDWCKTGAFYTSHGVTDIS